MSNPEINVDKLTHFGIGVFYKGAVHPWKNGTPEPYLEVAPEEQEALRKCLLGLADLPKGMALSVSVDSLPVVWQGMIQPYRAEPLGGFKRYVFYVPGIFFQLLIGEGVQDVVPKVSADPRHLILVDWKVWVPYCCRPEYPATNQIVFQCRDQISPTASAPFGNSM